MTQLDLLAGFYQCDNCGATADHVRRTRRLWLCDGCWATIMPDREKIKVERNDGTKRDTIGRYWEC